MCRRGNFSDTIQSQYYMLLSYAKPTLVQRYTKPTATTQLQRSKRQIIIPRQTGIRHTNISKSQYLVSFMICSWSELDELSPSDLRFSINCSITAALCWLSSFQRAASRPAKVDFSAASCADLSACSRSSSRFCNRRVRLPYLTRFDIRSELDGSRVGQQENSLLF